MPDNYLDEYNDDNYTYDANDANDASSSNSFTEVKNKNNKNNKNLNNKYKISIGLDNYGNDIHIYASKGQGTFIRHATNGNKTEYKVGSSDENLFFSVIDSRSSSQEKDPLIFYFDTPEQFENIMKNKIIISTETKKRWHDKYLKSKNRIK